MKLDPSKGLEYFKYRDIVMDAYAEACDATSRYFALDQAKDLDKRLKSLEEHFDQLVFWRVSEVFSELPQELVPASSEELDELLPFLSSLNPLQPIEHKRV